MLKSMFSGVTGLRSHQTMLDVIANNVANVNTVGFKSSSVLFSDVYYQTLSSATAPSATTGGVNGKQIGCGTTVASISLSNSRGGYSQTDKTMDIYISGEGYLVTQDAGGNIVYTRVGSLSFDPAGNLVDSNGNFVMGDIDGTLATYDPSSPIAIADLGPIKVDLTAYSNKTISSDGTITGIDTTGTTQIIAQIALASFANPSGLAQDGSMYMSETGNSGAAVYAAPGSAICGTLVTGGLEMSNVDLSKQLTDMIIAERGFQANSRVITTSDEILQELVNLKR